MSGERVRNRGLGGTITRSGTLDRSPRRAMPESTHKAADTAIDRVVREHAAVLERVAWGYVDNASDRDDLMQEVLTALWRALPRFRGESSERTFVLRVAHNRGITFAIRHRRRFEGLPDEGQLRDPAPLAEERLIAEQRRDRSEEHTSELQSRLHLVCRLLLEKKKN